MHKLQKLCYETEKNILDLIEQKLRKPIQDIKLTEEQSKKLRKWLKRFSHLAPYEFKK